MSTLCYASEGSTKTGAGLSRRALKRVALALAIGVAGVAVADLAYDYLTVGRYLESTDDAYVKANSTIIAPKVSGYIAEVLVADNETVKAGQVLARIDDRDFRTALKQARADVAAAEAAIHNLDSQIELQQPLIQQQAAEVEAAEANLKFAQQERSRYDDLMKSGSGTIQRAQQTDADAPGADRAVDAEPSGTDRSQQEDRRAVDPARPSRGSGRSGPRARTAGRTQSLLHAGSSRPSTAQWAPARSGSASSCRPEPS